MNRAIIFALVIINSSCFAQSTNNAKTLALARGLSQTLADEVLTPELATGRSLFKIKCGMCHGAGNTGTLMLARRMALDEALLANRKNNLPAVYVTSIVRNGIAAMPAFTRVEITNAELQQVARYLARNSDS